jgi:hypothetical protein
LWWEAHKAKLMDAKQEKRDKELAALALKQKAASKEKELVSDEMILHRMGYFRYYCMPWLRDKEKARMKRIAAIEHDLDKGLSKKK